MLRKPRLIKGQSVYLSGLRLPDGKLLIVASNQRLSKPIEIYRLRWQIDIYQPCCLHKCPFSLLVNLLSVPVIHKSIPWGVSNTPLAAGFQTGLR